MSVGLWVALLPQLCAQTFIPGQTYFGRSNYIEYIAGNLPVILSAPHGGSLTPVEIPDRTYGSLVRDTNTEDLARRVRSEMQNRLGLVPHIIICRLHREKIDCNRDIVEGAQGNVYAEIAWNEFQNYIIAARSNTAAWHGRGFYIDLHGHGHEIQQLELGYLLSSSELALSDTTLNSVFYENQSSIRALSQLSPLTFPALLRGVQSFGGLMVSAGYPSVPSPATPDPGANPYFNGGYNTVQHSSINGGTIDGVQIECNYTGVRDTIANRTSFAQSLAAVLEDYFAQHYGVTLRASYPKLWPGGGGSLGTASNWADGALPVNTNHLVFSGGGGSVSHNLAALTTLGSLAFSNSVSGSYTLSGNALALLGGITNRSAFPQIINNPITVAGGQTLHANPGDLNFGGEISLAGWLRVAGPMTVNGLISGPGGLTKLGAATLALTAVNAYQGPTTNLSGTISLNATATLGDGTGLLVLAGGEILARNTRSGAPIANPILMTASSTIAGNGTLTNSLRILPFSASNISATAGNLTIRNAGTNAFASNNVFRVRLTGGGFTFTRPITVGFAGDLEAMLSQLESYNDLAAGDQVFTATISGTGQFRRDAANPALGGRTVFTGVNSYSGGTILNAGTLLVNNPFGSGTGTGDVMLNQNGVLGGSGRIAGAVYGTGTISPGDSVGILTLDGGLDLSSGGTLHWQLSGLSSDDAGTNFDQLLLTGGNLALGGSSKLQLEFTMTATAPNAGDPFWMRSQTWKIIPLTTPATNLGGTRFTSILNGSHATGNFTNYADAEGSIWLAYLANPAVAPKIQSASMVGTGEFILAVTTETNRTYILQSTTDLANPVWSNLSTNVAPADSLVLTNDPGGDPARFYRVKVVP